MYTAVLFLATVFSVCTTPFAGAQQPLPDPVVHLTFDDPNDLGNDSSGNGRHGVVGVTGVTWQRDAERQGVADFTDTAFSADTSIMVDLGGPLPGDDFTVACWMTSRANTGSFFQLEPVEDPPVAQTGTFEKVVWGGMSGSGFVWGRIVENGDDFSGLDTNVYMTDLNVWHHYAYRGRADATSSTGFRFEVFVDGNQVGPQTEYAGTLNTHGQLNVGCTHNGRVDDVRVYNIALSDSQIKDLTLPQLPTPVLHLTFDDESAPYADSSPSNAVVTGEGSASAPAWVDDPERRGSMSFDSLGIDGAGGAGRSYLCTAVDIAEGDEWTITTWAKRKNIGDGNGGVFVMGREQTNVCDIDGANDFRSWIGHTGIAPGVWGRVAEATPASFKQICKRDGTDPVLAFDVWTHLALRTDGTTVLQLLVDGQQVCESFTNGDTMGYSERLLIGNAHVGTFPGLLDDFRLYNVALTDGQIGNLQLATPPTPVLHLKFDDELDPYADSSPSNAVVTGEGTASAPAWEDDPERRGSMSFDSLGIDGAGGAGRSYLCTAVDIAEGDEWTITTWAKRKNIGDGNGGVFVMGREQENVCDIDGANDFRSWIGHTGIAPGVWGRVAEADPASFKQICKRDGTDPVLEFDVWTHLALRTDGTTVLQLLVDGQQVCESFTNGDTMGYSERLLIGNAHVGTFPGLLDDFRLYNVALTDGQIGTIISGLCPAEGDSHCLSMTIEGPPQRKRGIYRVNVDASDDSGDVIFYTFLAEKTGDPSATLLIEAQRDDPSASFYLSPGEWQISVTADDGPCPDEASDATCSLDALNLIQVIPGEPSLDNVDFHFSFDDANDPLVDNSGNGFVATWSPANSEQWVNDSVRGGVLEFPGVTQETEADRDPEDGYIKVKDGPKTVGIDARGIDRDGGGFTICVWVNQFSDANAPGTFGSGGIFNYSNCCDEDGDGVIGDPYVTPGDHDGPGWNWNPLNPDRLTNAAVTVSSGDPNDPSFAFTWNGGDGAPRGGNIGGDFPSDTWTHMCLRGSIPDVHPTQALFTHRVEMVINGTQLPDRDGDEPPFAHSREDFGLQQISRAYLGKGNNPQSASFRGRLDDWRHYDRMLSNAEIQEVMEGFVEPFDIDYIRGDANGSGVPDVSDAIGILTYLFLGGFETTCLDALDFDGTTIIDVSDSLNFLSWLFLGTYTPPNPIPPACGLPDDPLTRISCESFAPCE